MSPVEAARVRQELGQLQPTIEEKTAAIDTLFREFHLRKDSPLEAHCNQIALLVSDLDSKLQAVDDAIGGTNLDAIAAAVNDLRQLQMSVLRVEETVRKMRNA